MDDREREGGREGMGRDGVLKWPIILCNQHTMDQRMHRTRPRGIFSHTAPKDNDSCNCKGQGLSLQFGFHLTPFAFQIRCRTVR